MTPSGLELITFRCPACDAMIDVAEVTDMRRVNRNTVALTCPHCDEWIHEDWPGYVDDPPAFLRVEKD